MTRVTVGSVFLSILGIGIFLFVVLKSVPTLKESACIRYKEFKKLRLYGVIEKKYIDSSQHSYPICEIKQFEKDTVIKVKLLGAETAYEEIFVGDTIYKMVGNDTVNLRNVNGKKMVKIDFGCDSASEE